MNDLLKKIKFDDKGLIAAIVQDCENNQILMMAYMNQESLEKTIQSGFATYFSRSRNQLWKKGETSKNLQEVVSIDLDCDYDCLLIRVKQTGVACHTGAKSCFFNKVL